MIESELWDYDDAGEFADAVASDIAFIIGQAIEARGDAVIALPGRAPNALDCDCASIHVNFAALAGLEYVGICNGHGEEAASASGGPGRPQLRD